MHNSDKKLQLLNAILVHVPFDGWSDAAFVAACQDVDIPRVTAELLCPRRAVDLARLNHELADQALFDRLQSEDLTHLKYSEKVAFAIMLRLRLSDDPELVRKATALFALPHLSSIGAQLIWGTADTIWRGLGDTSDDLNWYSKRATLSAVYASAVLYWLGDESEDWTLTQAFVERRIANVMSIEKGKSALRQNALFGPAFKAFEQSLSQVKAPRAAASDDGLPGYWHEGDL